MAPITVHTRIIAGERVLGYGIVVVDGDPQITIHLTNGKQIKLVGAEADVFVNDLGDWGRALFRLKPNQQS